MIIQIYALTDPEEAAWVASLGVEHVGFVAGDYGIVHGELTFERARALVQALPSSCRGVALTMTSDQHEIVHMAKIVRPSIVHISSDPEMVPAQKCKALRERLPAGIELMKAIPVVGEESVALAREYHDACDFLLLDTKVSGLPGVGATGETHDWNLSRRIVEESPLPVILAGGLDASNVARAIRVVSPDGVDSNTGTNRHGDLVRKDRARVHAFVSTAREGFSAAHE